VPLSSESEGSLEQDYSLIRYSKENSSFEIVEKIMRTAFSLRVDESRMLNDSLDADYFETVQK